VHLARLDLNGAEIDLVLEAARLHVSVPNARLC
jgi:hypothetical protein